MKKDDMSPAAKELAEKCGVEGSVAAALKAKPSLAKGLDEYMEWRDDEVRCIAGSTKVSSAKHPLAQVAKKLKKKTR